MAPWTLPGTFRDCHAFHVCFILWVESLHMAPDKAITMRVSKVLREQKGYQSIYSNFTPAASDALELFVAGAIWAIGVIDREL